MNTYIINLKESTERKRYMESLLKPYEDFLNIRFIEAVNGKNFSEEQIKTSVMMTQRTGPYPPAITVHPLPAQLLGDLCQVSDGMSADLPIDQVLGMQNRHTG